MTEPTFLPWLFWFPRRNDVRPRAPRYTAPATLTLVLVALRLRGFRAGWVVTTNGPRALVFTRSTTGNEIRSEVGLGSGRLRRALGFACRVECALWNWRIQRVGRRLEAARRRAGGVEL